MKRWMSKRPNIRGRNTLDLW